MNPLTHKATNIEFLHPNPVVAADALLEIGTTVISALLLLDEHSSHTKNFLRPEILLPVGVQLPCLLSCQDTHC